MTTRSMGLDVYMLGNIASGKTTLARLLEDRIPRSVYVPEPVEKNPFLPLYLLDQSRWGMACMARYFVDYAREWESVSASRSYVYHFVDAGTPTNRLLYGRYLAGEGVISPDEHELYSTVCDLAERAYSIPPAHAFIYLRSAPETCMERMRARGWGFQVGAVEMAYLEKLHRYVEEMVAMLAAEGFPLLVLSSEGVDFCRPDGQEQAAGRVHEFLAGLPAAPA